MDTNIESVSSKTISSIKWNVFNQFISQGFVFGGSVIISRILMPEAFGLFAMITFLSNCLAILIGLGFNHAVVQNRQLSRQDLTSLFWINVCGGGIVSILFFLSATLIAEFYQQPKLYDLVRIISPVFLLCAAAIVPSALLIREFSFKKIAIADILAASTSYAGAIVLAIKGFGVLALCFQYLSFYAIKVIMSFYFTSWRPSLVIELTSFHKVYHFSKSLLPSQVLTYFTGNIDLLLAGKFFGKTELGLYGRANSLMMLPLNNLSALVATSYITIFASLQERKSELLKSYTDCVKLIITMLGVLLFTLMVVSDEFIYVVFGPPWISLAPMFRILSIAGILGGFTGASDALFISQGKTRVLLKITTIEKSVMVLSIFVGIVFGILGLCWAKVFSQFFSLIIRFYYQQEVLSTSIFSWLMNFVKIFIAFGVMVMAALVSKILFGNYGYLIVLLITGTVSVATTALSLTLLKEPIAVIIKDYLVRKIQKA